VVVEARSVDVVEAGVKRLDGVSFAVRSGEILGLIGVAGNGQATLGRLVTGLATPDIGTLTLGGRPLSGLGPRDLVAMGVGRIPEDRHAEGVVGEMAVWENAVLERVGEPRFSRRGFVLRDAAKSYARSLIERFDIRGAAPDTRTRLLSGGNMQKLILGRSLSGTPRFVVANQPTRGLDEGAIAAVHAELLAARAAGAAVLLISEDLDEVTALADRIQAVVKGRLSPPVDGEDADARLIGLMMAGVWED
jgi:simple sugar transport system ATP-binding protein